MRPKYSPLTRQRRGHFQKHSYNDARLESKGAQLLGRMTKTQSNVVHQISESPAEEKSFYRFLHNARVSPSEMIDHIYQPSIREIRDRSLLVIGDPSEISLKGQIGQIRDGHRVGVLSDNKTPGFYLQSHLVLDAQSGHGLGLSDLIFWTRKKAWGSKNRPRGQSQWKDRETYCWMQGIIHSQEVLAEAKEVLYVFDSAADMADLWATSLEQPYDLLIRCQQYNRKLVNSDLKLFEFLDSLEVAGSYELDLSELSRRNISRSVAQKREKRKTRMEVRFSALVMKLKTEKGWVKVPLYAVDAREKADSVPPGEDPIHWKLLTSRPVESFEKAIEMIHFYQLRWQIEELYRTSKKKGFGIEQTELTSLDAIFKQTILSLEAAFRVMRLVMSRDKDDHQGIEEIFSQPEIRCLEALNHKFEGKTQKLKNPWPKDQLAWAAWIIARLSGWKGYQSRTPAGPIRMKRGLDKFNTYFDAWILFRCEEDVGDP